MKPIYYIFLFISFWTTYLVFTYYFHMGMAEGLYFGVISVTTYVLFNFILDEILPTYSIIEALGVIMPTNPNNFHVIDKK